MSQPSPTPPYLFGHSWERSVTEPTIIIDRLIRETYAGQLADPFGESICG
ncbi:MAG: hypothetical protein LBU80_03085 [Rikenellaceae bacterium]|nr:hypothetical protein [Rikenellaceae bacterium]